MTAEWLTHRQWLARGKERLCRAALSEGEWEAWLLFSAAFSMDRTAYLLHADEEAAPEGASRYEAYLEERLRHRPTAYIIGSWGFMGLDFQVNENVLIPRQDTEVLAEEALRRIQGTSGRVLDLCTGSGALAVSLAHYAPQCEVWATDISEEALAVAGTNVRQHQACVTLRQGDLFAALPETLHGSFSMIVSNPPYIAEEEYRTLAPEVTAYEPKLALTAPHEGLLFYEKIADEAADWLRPGASLGLEIGYQQGERVMNLLQSRQYCDIQLHQDLNGLDRVVWCRRAL